MSILTLALLLASPVSHASVGQSTYACKVASFDTQYAWVTCDPANPKKKMKTPRAWLDKNLKSNTSVKLNLDAKNEKEWFAMNDMPLKEGETK